MRVGFAGSMAASRTTSEWRSQAIAQGNRCIYRSRRQHQHHPEHMHAKFVEHPGHETEMVQDLTTILSVHRRLISEGGSTATL
jgi:hypothetical protein